MIGDFDDVVGCIGVRFLVISDDNLINPAIPGLPRASRPRLSSRAELGFRRLDQLSKYGSPRFERMLQPKHGLSTSSPNTARRASRGCFSRSMGSVIALASGPARRTTPIPPRPGGVEIATIVSSRFTKKIVAKSREVSRHGSGRIQVNPRKSVG